jgi:hypothetical protein
VECVNLPQPNVVIAVRLFDALIVGIQLRGDRLVWIAPKALAPKDLRQVNAKDSAERIE